MRFGYVNLKSPVSFLNSITPVKPGELLLIIGLGVILMIRNTSVFSVKVYINI